MEPNFVWAHYNLATIAFVNLNDFQTARTHYEKALYMRPDVPEIWQNYGILLRKGFQDSKGAETAFKKALELEPGLSISHHALGILYSETSRLDEARNEFINAISSNKNFINPYQDLARLAFVEEKNEEKCRQLLNDILDIDKLHPLPKIVVARILSSKLNDYQSAVDLYEKALKLSPNLENIHYEVSLIYGIKLKNYQQAKRHIEIAISLNPNSAIFFNAMGSFIEEGATTHENLNEAVEYYERAISIDKNYEDAYLSLAGILTIKLGNSVRAHEILEQFISLKPDNSARSQELLAMIENQGNIPSVRCNNNVAQFDFY